MKGYIGNVIQTKEANIYHITSSNKREEDQGIRKYKMYQRIKYSLDMMRLKNMEELLSNENPIRDARLDNTSLPRHISYL